MRGIRLGRDELIAKFGLSNRLAARVGALLARKVDITAVPLELARPGSATERMLCHSRLLSEADNLSVDLLQAIAKECGVEEGPFDTATGEGWTTICLQEEMLAEEGWRETAAERGETDLARREETMVRSHVLEPEEASSLYTPEEIARLKLEALTATDSGNRVAAIRRLMYAPITREEKGGLCLKVLLDPISPARSEAVKALEALGFNREAAESLQRIFEGDERNRAMAIRRVGMLLEGVSESERRVLVEVLLETLREMTERGLAGHIIEVLANGMHRAGSHMVVWNTGNHPSGAYFYRLRFGSFSETRKMVLLK